MLIQGSQGKPQGSTGSSRAPDVRRLAIAAAGGVAVALSLSLPLRSIDSLVVLLTFLAIPVIHAITGETRSPSSGTATPWQPWDYAVTIVVGLSLASRIWMWAHTGGLPFIETGRESFLNFMFGHNARDFFSWVLQDMSTGSDPESHPYFYLNHPNLFARLVSIGWSALGLGLQHQILVTICLGALGLLVLYGALRHAFGPAAGFGGIFFAATNYGTFVTMSVSLLWGIHHILLWVLFYVLAVDGGLASRKSRIGCAILFFFFSLSDWGFFIFVSALTILWIVCRSDHLPWTRILTCVVVPAVAGIVFYEGTIFLAIGPQLFMENLSINVLHRVGQFGGTTAASALADMRAHNLVVWPRGGQVLHFSDLLRHWWTVIGFNAGPLRFVVFGVSSLATAYLLMHLHLKPIVVGFALVLFVPSFVGFGGPLLMLAPLAIVTTALVGLCSREKNGKLLPVKVKPDSVGEFHGLLAFIACAVFATTTTFAVFPDYLAYNLFNLWGPNPPAGVVELLSTSFLFAFSSSSLTRAAKSYAHSKAVFLAMKPTRFTRDIYQWRPLPTWPQAVSLGIVVLLAFGIGTVGTAPIGPRGETANAQPYVFGLAIAVCLVFLAHWHGRGLAVISPDVIGWRPVKRSNSLSAAFAKPRDVKATAAIVAAALCLIAAEQIHWSLDGYGELPPHSYAYAGLLSGPEFRRRSFVTNNDEAAVWVFTRQWVYATGNELPVPPITSSGAYFANWRSTNKYEYPDYFLCDYDSRFVAEVNRINVPGGGPNDYFSSCDEVARYLVRIGAGDLVAYASTFAVVRYRKEGAPVDKRKRTETSVRTVLDCLIFSYRSTRRWHHWGAKTDGPNDNS